MLDIFTYENVVALLTLTSLEIVLGIDNVVFIAILTGRLPPEKQKKARFIGLSLAMLMRIGLLLAITWIMTLTTPLFELFGEEFSGKDLILILGGAFLMAKATYEIHHMFDAHAHDEARPARHSSFAVIIVMILALDLVFSLDSVITAVGMAEEIWVMVAAVVIAVLVMMIFAGPIARFVARHPAMKTLALSFLLLIGLTLVLDGVGQHVPKGYIYSAMAFSLFVELLNLRISGGGKPVEAKGS